MTPKASSAASGKASGLSSPIAGVLPPGWNLSRTPSPPIRSTIHSSVLAAVPCVVRKARPPPIVWSSQHQGGQAEVEQEGEEVSEGERYRPGGNLRVEFQGVQERWNAEAEEARGAQRQQDARADGEARQPGPAP